jgi:hypothetical protein
MLNNLLRNVSPASLKKYGIYAILSFFISVSAIIGTDDLRMRNADIKYERSQNETLRKMLDDQYRLKVEQERLLHSIDTTKHKTYEGH